MANISPLKAFQKYAWTLLFAFWALHFVLSVRDFFPNLQDLCVACLLGAQTAIQSSTGMTWGQLASANPKLASFLASTLIDDGISGWVWQSSGWSFP